MSHDEALDRAIEDLLAGRHVDASKEPLPEDAPAMLEAAKRLARGRMAFAGEPRPGFVLDLEQQLRADLRTGLARRVEGARRRVVVTRVAVAGMVLAGALFSALLASRGATVGQPLYPLKRLTEVVRLELTTGADEQASLWCDVAWTRLLELRSLVERPRRGAQDVSRTLADIVAGYGRALTLAGTIEDDPRVLWSARSGTSFAAEELAALAKRDSLTPSERQAIEEARQALRVRLLDSRVMDRPPSERRGAATLTPDPTPAPGAAAAVGSGSAHRPLLPGRPSEGPLRPPVGASGPSPTPTPAVSEVPGQGTPPIATPTTAVPATATNRSPTSVPSPTPPATVTLEPPAPRPPPRAATAQPSATPPPTEPASNERTATPQTGATVAVTPTLAPPSATVPAKPTDDRWPTATPVVVEPTSPVVQSPPPPIAPTASSAPGATPSPLPPEVGPGRGSGSASGP